MPNPYEDAIEALTSGTLTPDNARRVLDYVHGLPALIEAAASRLSRDGRAYVEDFPSEPEAGEVAIMLGQQMARMHGPVDEFREVFNRVHDPDLKRLDEPRQQEEKWDFARNRE
jgi:hypothetical protein